jgi:hypothetical protein
LEKKENKSEKSPAKKHSEKSKQKENIHNMKRTFADRGAKTKKGGAIESGAGNKTTGDL